MCLPNVEQIIEAMVQTPIMKSKVQHGHNQGTLLDPIERTQLSQFSFIFLNLFTIQLWRALLEWLILFA